VQNNLNAELSHKNTAETDIFTMTKGKICVCHGKKCRRVIFLTMRGALFMNIMVKQPRGHHTYVRRPLAFTIVYSSYGFMH